MSALCYQLDRWEQQSQHGESSAFSASRGDHGRSPRPTALVQLLLDLIFVLRWSFRKCAKSSSIGGKQTVSLDTLKLGGGGEGSPGLEEQSGASACWTQVSAENAEEMQHAV